MGLAILVRAVVGCMACLLGTVLVGSVILLAIPRRLRPTSFVDRAFCSAIVGLLALSTGTAVYFTRGRTVLLALPIIGACLVWALARERRLNEEGPGRTAEPQGGLLLSGIAVACVLAWVCVRTFHAGPIPYQTPHADYVFYAKSFEAMRQTGIEAACALDPILRLDGCSAPRPYHHFDLWLAGAWSTLTGLPSLLCYVLISGFVLAMTLVWGFWSIQDALARQTLAHRSAALAAVFFTPLSFAWVAVPKWAPVWDPRAILAAADWFLDYSAPLVEPVGLKLLPVFLLLVAATRLQLTRGFAASAIPLVALFVVNPAAGAWIGGIAVALAWGFLRKQLTLGDAIPMGASVAAAGLVYLWLYAGPGNSDLALNGPLWALPPPRWSGFLLVRTVLQVLLLYAPFLFLLGAALARRGVVPLRRLAPLGLSLLVSSGIGFVVWAASTYGDGVQFFATSAFPALNLLVLTSLTVMEGRWARVAATVLGIVAIAAWLGAIQRLVRPASHAADYATFIASKQVPRRTMGAFIRNPEELRRSSPFALNLQWNALGGVLGFLPNHVGSVSLNAPVVDGVSQDPLVSLHERRRAFVQALSDVRRSTPGVAEGLVQRRFVEENGLKYLILAPGVELPDSLAPLVTQMHEDSRTGERFCWLRRDE